MEEIKDGMQAHSSTGPPRIASRTSRKQLANAIAEDLILALLAGVFVWHAFLPGWKSLNTDFPDYYLAARLYREGSSLAQIYDWTWVQRQKDHAAIPRPIVTFTLLTPFSLLPVLPFSSLPALSAKRAWLVLNVLLLALVGYLLCRMSTLGARRVAIIVLLAVEPLSVNFICGQEYVLLLLLFTIAAWLYFKNRPLASGLTLAVGGALKIYPALFLIFFLRKKQWRAAVGLVLGSIGLWLLSAGLFGVETIRTYLVEVLPWPLRAEGQDPYDIAWNSFSAVLHRIFIAEPELNPHPFVHLPALYAILQPFCQATIFVPLLWLLGSSRLSDKREQLHWGTFVAMLLILSTNPAPYDFVALILTTALAVDYLMDAGRTREAAVVVWLYALVCFPLSRLVRGSPEGWRTLLAVPRLWAMTGLWICLLLVSRPPIPQSLWTWLKSREAAVLAGVWLALVVTATTLNLIQMRGEFENYATRLFVAPECYLDTDPALAAEKVLFTAMANDGYHTAELSGSRLSWFSFATDSFHPTMPQNSSLGWIELASRHSRIVRFALGTEPPSLETVSTEVDDAEKPAVSTDGKWLAFIRESRGRGSLWVKDLQPAVPDAAKRQAERPLSGQELDVMEAAFDGADDIIFAAARGGGQPALFQMRPDRTDILDESASAPRRYPAVSPDGRWLAFSQRDRGSWQLWVRDLRTRVERRLTDSQCNSTVPAWYADSKHLVYATDCGRGYGLGALCKIQAVP